MNMERPVLEFLIKRVLVHLVPKENTLHPSTIENIISKLADDIIVMDEIMGVKVEPLKLNEKDIEAQKYIEEIREKMLNALGVPRQYVEPALSIDSQMAYDRMLNTYGPNIHKLKKLNINTKSTES